MIQMEDVDGGGGGRRRAGGGLGLFGGCPHGGCSGRPMVLWWCSLWRWW